MKRDLEKYMRSFILRTHSRGGIRTSLVEEGCVICRATQSCGRFLQYQPVQQSILRGGKWDDAHAPAFRDAKAQTAETSIQDLVKGAEAAVGSMGKRGFSKSSFRTILRDSSSSFSCVVPQTHSDIFYRLSKLPYLHVAG